MGGRGGEHDSTQRCGTSSPGKCFKGSTPEAAEAKGDGVEVAKGDDAPIGVHDAPAKVEVLVTITKSCQAERVGIHLLTGEDGVYIKALFYGGLAASSPLRVGDLLQSVNGSRITGHVRCTGLSSSPVAAVLLCFA